MTNNPAVFLVKIHATPGSTNYELVRKALIDAMADLRKEDVYIGVEEVR